MSLAALVRHQSRLKKCRRCPDMHQPVVTGEAVLSPVMLLGQAPGSREIELKKPFAWTAGRTLFQWFESIGMPESHFRHKVYMAAVCRCYPGKNQKGSGDRVPSQPEIQACDTWLRQEWRLLQPQLIIPVGKLAISRLVEVDKLSQVVGRRFSAEVGGVTADIIPLPHPSGASTWHRTEPGSSLLQKALKRIEKHPVWRGLLEAEQING